MVSCEQLDALRLFLEGGGIRFDADVSLRCFSYFRTGGIARVVVFPSNEGELVSFLEYAHGNAVEYKLVGGTANLLFLDDKTYGVLLSLRRMDSVSYDRPACRVVAEAGAELSEFTRRALVWGLSGFEGLEGIPGTLGGAVFMNAGAYGWEIKDKLLFVDTLRRDGAPRRFSREELQFGYRQSLFKQSPGEYIVLRAVFEATPGDPEEISGKMELLHAKRHKYQDFIYPTLGTLFAGCNVHESLGLSDRRYQLMIKIINKFYYTRKIRRERPMNCRPVNRFVCRYFGWEFDVLPFSDKTMNCLANRGQHTDRFLEYIELLRKHLPGHVQLENEIVDGFHCREPGEKED